MICNVCSGSMCQAFRHAVLGKYEVQYFQCPECGFLRTEEPHWLPEAYSSAIASADTGIVQRNLYLSKVASALLWRMFGGGGRFLDAAGGWGLFTRLMRDVGFDYYWCDPHAENLAARGFEGGAANGPYAAVTAFEVLEHVADPLAFLSALVREMGARTLLISTELFAGEPPPADWWYYAFNTGQHISFYRRSTLEYIGRSLGLKLFSSGSVHMWTDRRISQWEFRLMSSPRLSSAYSLPARLQMQSKVWSDHQRLIKSHERSSQ